MAQGQSLVRVNPDRQRHLLHARSGGHRAPPAPSRRALKTREETMSGIWRSPALKRKSATRSGQRTITSTPSIILDRCPRIQKERKSPCCDGHLRSGRSDLLLLPRQSPLMALRDTCRDAAICPESRSKRTRNRRRRETSPRAQFAASGATAADWLLRLSASATKPEAFTSSTNAPR